MFLDRKVMQKKIFKGFTLSETVMVLFIIGLLAVITLPDIIINYQRQVTVTKVRNMYSQLDSAYRRFNYDNRGDLELFCGEGVQVVNGRERPIQHGFYYGAQNPITMFQRYFSVKMEAGTDVDLQREIFGNVDNWYIDADWHTFLLKDGTVIQFQINDQANPGNEINQVYYITDRRKPHREGENVFMFSFSPGTKSVVPVWIPLGSLIPGVAAAYQQFGVYCPDGINGRYRENNPDYQNISGMITNALNSCRNSVGLDCTAWVVLNGNMNYLRKR